MALGRAEYITIILYNLCSLARSWDSSRWWWASWVTSGRCCRPVCTGPWSGRSPSTWWRWGRRGSPQTLPTQRTTLEKISRYPQQKQLLFLILASPRLSSDLPKLFTNFADFFRQFLRHPALKIGGFVVPLHISTFSPILKGFNIRKETL